MKKVYEKPRVIIETFTLNQHIASCDFIMKNSTLEDTNCTATGSDSLGIFTQEDKIFNAGTACNATPSDFCTYTGSSNVVVFGS